ncbi:hypothetical protein TDB9533_01441 [Thalassocella blandensis]|nr:hypothetical protein TDB9533_01441 [Thalassocella blandensis]
MTLDQIHQFIRSLDLFDYTVIIFNIVIIALAKPLVYRISSRSLPDKTLLARVYMIRGLNFIILLVYAYQYLYLPSSASGSGGLTILSILAILYMANITNFIAQHFIHKHYGKPREIGDKVLYIETYQTRLLSILAAIIITIIAIIAIIDQLGFDSLLEAGGVLGIIGVFLGLTQGSWAPDIISGLIILNSDMFEEGDIVETDSGILGRVYKTKLFHTEILNISNNHRIMIRNSHLRDCTIHNLSKFASAKGLRECLSFNIGYDVDGQAVKAMLNDAFEKALAAEIPIESNSPPEIKCLETGDHAICWGILFYIKSVDKVLNIRRDFREVILSTSKLHNISLATPFTVEQKNMIATRNS